MLNNLCHTIKQNNINCNLIIQSNQSKQNNSKQITKIRRKRIKIYKKSKFKRKNLVRVKILLKTTRFHHKTSFDTHKQPSATKKLKKTDIKDPTFDPKYRNDSYIQRSTNLYTKFCSVRGRTLQLERW